MPSAVTVSSPDAIRERVRQRIRDGVSDGISNAERRTMRATAPARRGRRRPLWSLMFTLHQVLGLASGLVVAVVCFTGALLVFQNEITAALHPARNHVAVGSARLDVDALIALTAPRVHGRIDGVTTYADPARPVKLVARDGVQVYVDPYTGRIVDVQHDGERFFEITEGIHRRLLAGEVGRRVVGIATLCFVVILLSGIVIWWPRTMHALKARLTFKHPTGWKRRNYDLHVVLGIYATLVLLVVGATGLVWSFRTVGRAVDGLTPHGRATPPPPHSRVVPGLPTIGAQAALNAASRALGPTTTLVAYLPSRPRDAVMVMGLPPNAPWRQAMDVAYVDRYSGRVLRVDRFAKRPLGELARRATNPLHVGSLYGLPSEIAAFLACLIGTLAPFTGAVIWINRKWPRALRWPACAR
jgi:uncharacterized iron-regulated membrane protein